MRLPIEFIDQDLPELMTNHSKLVMSGRTEGVPENTMKAILRGIEATKDNQGLIINLAFNYGGRDELIRAIHKLVIDVQDLKVSKDSINETLLQTYLDQPMLPDPDLIIRTGGEQRLSNFLLWESAYAEFYFTKEFWPEMTGDSLEKILLDFASRNRRFGGV
jgi:undecaprenyl diphosphate synthase